MCGLLAACSGPITTDGGRDPSGNDERLADALSEGGSIFGDGGLFGVIQGSNDSQNSGIPVNKYLWQASLDTLSFLPLASTDPFTGVIATDWGASPTEPGERFKVTAYMVRPALAASSLKVAVFREIRNGEGLWVPAAVDPSTPREIEDAILVRARQMRIAELEGNPTG